MRCCVASLSSARATASRARRLERVALDVPGEQLLELATQRCIPRASFVEELRALLALEFHRALQQDANAGPVLLEWSHG